MQYVMKGCFIMKKLLALILCLMLAFSAVGVFAEEAVTEETAAEPIEMLFDGVWVRFEDGFEFYLPSNWVEYEVTEEYNAKGLFYAAGSEDMSYACVLGWSPMEYDMTISELQTVMATKYPDAEAVEVNGVGLVTYVDPENNMLTCLALDATEPGFYMFAFSPADDAEFRYMASLIASSIRCFTVE